MSAKMSISLLILFLLLTNSSSQQPINHDELTALLAIKNTLTSLTNPQFFSTWNFSPTAPPPCSSFSGLTCSDSRVTTLTLGTGLSNSPGLAGTLSPSLSKLTSLTQLILFSGIVTGPIPPSIGSLTNLRILSLTNNRLTGPIPAEILHLPNLHTLDLSHNLLSGSIPPSLSSLTSLKVLILSSNSLSSTFPEKLPNELLHLDISDNELTGELPAKLPEQIRYFSVSNNRMWGPIGALGDSALAELAYVDLSMNGFSGPIPTDIFRQSLTSVFLQRNNFSGGVPDCPTWQYGAGSIVDVSHNCLEGELSAALAGVETVFVNNNRLTGRVPEVYVDGLRDGTIRTLYLQHNFITDFSVGSGIPSNVEVCASYNCLMVPPVGLEACPASAGDQLSRPAYQCSRFHGKSG